MIIFEGRSPQELVNTGDPAEQRRVLTILIRIDYGVFSYALHGENLPDVPKARSGLGPELSPSIRRRFLCRIARVA